MFLSNVEIKSFIKNYTILFMITVILCVGVSFISVNIIKDKVVENNQAIIGSILSKHPNLESNIVGIITQGKSKEDISLGKEILKKYSYDKNIRLNNEPIIRDNIKDIFSINLLSIFVLFISILILVMHYFKTIYSDIKDMTDYVYNSSEGKKFEMKNKNQEGQIGLLKTELLEMTNILKEKVELLSKEKIFLNDTISDISHQLKTPMTSLIILNDLMYDDLPEESKIEFLEKIKSQLNRMEWLIKSMLKLSKVEAKVINFKNEKVNILELIKMSIQPSLIPIELKNIDVSINGDSEAMFLGDMDWSIEALVNIIKNCVEHTFSSGSLDISYEENSLYTEIVIKDSGEGIDKKDLPHIFKRFYKGKSSSKEDSVGIGLAMAKSIIEGQNGDIYVKSEKNKGTQFNIIFHKI
ncbi:HAMP domain-containing sensor histidine kinase [Paraclostridium sp. MRS3W1]|uniref:sensor histidine kinase n=1 Tax=Paraclostridium sp. MRS3W1 TaxID=2800798 RepID=UPI0028FD2E8E|nr:HAMP domain-containing sensor histidine kinase [Paraclostridium sp. MRS3W1]MDU0296864.1 HAMP domain-containing sensor histidine kinase [Paraclostridium sp. MRS3W1]